MCDLTTQYKQISFCLINEQGILHKWLYFDMSILVDSCARFTTGLAREPHK